MVGRYTYELERRQRHAFEIWDQLERQMRAIDLDTAPLPDVVPLMEELRMGLGVRGLLALDSVFRWTGCQAFIDAMTAVREGTWPGEVLIDGVGTAAESPATEAGRRRFLFAATAFLIQLGAPSLPHHLDELVTNLDRPKTVMVNLLRLRYPDFFSPRSWSRPLRVAIPLPALIYAAARGDYRSFAEGVRAAYDLEDPVEAVRNLHELHSHRLHESEMWGPFHRFLHSEEPEQLALSDVVGVLRFGLMCRQDLDECAHRLQDGYEARRIGPFAKLLLGLTYLDRKSARHDFHCAYRILREAAEEGSAEAACYVAEICASSEPIRFPEEFRERNDEPPSSLSQSDMDALFSPAPREENPYHTPEEAARFVPLAAREWRPRWVMEAATIAADEGDPLSAMDHLHRAAAMDTPPARHALVSLLLGVADDTVPGVPASALEEHVKRHPTRWRTMLLLAAGDINPRLESVSPAADRLQSLVPLEGFQILVRRAVHHSRMIGEDELREWRRMDELTGRL